MKNILKILPGVLLTVILYSCDKNTDLGEVILVKNPLQIDRINETVEVDTQKLNLNNQDSLNYLKILDLETRDTLITQFVDEDGDGLAELLLFQPQLKSLSEKRFRIIKIAYLKEEDTSARSFSRFVPERTDDYAWENNKVAFRTYGPTARKMIEENIKGGTLSSGIDAWLKKVEYPIIDKWYEKTLSGNGSYHEDTGEGLDNFHVGPSRGVGGTAIKKDSVYLSNTNFDSWKTITNGPIRTSFVLTYDTTLTSGHQFSEEKHISLDYGNNLSKFKIKVNGLDTLAAGLTLHNNEGETAENSKEGWVIYWEPLDGSELGTAIVARDSTFLESEKYVSSKKDLSNMYAHLKPKNGEVEYYAGFGWKESGEFKTKEAWEEYISLFSQKINSPLIVDVVAGNSEDF